VASSSQPYTRDEWNELLTDINDKLDEEGCDDIDRLPLVDAEHRWEKEDIREARRVMEESCDTINFNAELDMWTVEVVQEIEDQVPEMGCDCEEEVPLCSNAGVVDTETVYDGTLEGCTSAGPAHDNPSEIEDTVELAKDNFNAALSSYTNITWPNYCSAKKALASATAGGDVGEIAAAEAALDAATAALDSDKADMAAATDLAREYFSLLRRSDAAPVLGLIANEDPWDESECYCEDKEAAPAAAPSRCIVTWALYWSLEGEPNPDTDIASAQGFFDHRGIAIPISFRHWPPPWEAGGISTYACHDGDDEDPCGPAFLCDETFDSIYILRKSYSPVTTPITC